MALTPKREKFARLIALEGLTQSEAYRQAYDCSPNSAPRTVWDNASQLAHNTEVAQRIAELRASLQRKTVEELAWNRARLVAELEINATSARSAKQYAPSNRALELIGKATGILADTPSLPQAAIQIVFVTEGRSSPPLAVAPGMVEALPELPAGSALGEPPGSAEGEGEALPGGLPRR